MLVLMGKHWKYPVPVKHIISIQALLQTDSLLQSRFLVGPIQRGAQSDVNYGTTRNALKYVRNISCREFAADIYKGKGGFQTVVRVDQWKEKGLRQSRSAFKKCGPWLGSIFN